MGFVSSLQWFGGKVKESTWARFLAVILITWTLWWALVIVDTVSGNYLYGILGIVPRTPMGLIGVPCAWMVQAGWANLILNTIGFFFLAWGTMWARGMLEFAAVSVFIIIVSGFATWIVGRDMAHVGAGAWILGLWAFLLAINCYDRNWKSVVASLTFGLIYAIILFTAFSATGGSNVSWEMGLCGFISGIFAAILLGIYSRFRRKREVGMKNSGPPPAVLGQGSAYRSSGRPQTPTEI
mmetsp:Transcript_43552/g.70705  ORF Transcript_43552/g.70705 Transcript_43552/m.70705 type:complete len:239 (-) Transcript_43552:3047-3763(-)